MALWKLSIRPSQSSLICTHTHTHTHIRVIHGKIIYLLYAGMRIVAGWLRQGVMRRLVCEVGLGLRSADTLHGSDSRLFPPYLK